LSCSGLGGIPHRLVKRAHAATARRSMRRYLLEGTDGEEIAA
jgi:hypothetical protein